VCIFAPDMESIFDNGLPSLVESWYSGLPTTKNVAEADVIVNPEHSSYYGKTIIINSPVFGGDLSRLRAANTIISRFPLKDAELRPYDVRASLKRLRVDVLDDGIVTPYSDVESLCSSDGMDVRLGRLCTGIEKDGFLTYLGFLYRGAGLRINSRVAISKFVKSWSLRMECLRTPSGTRLRMPYMSPEQDSVVSVASRSGSFFGPVLGPRRPNKKMNVKLATNALSYKFKTYRITDAHRSYDLRYNPDIGYYLFDKLDRQLTSSDVCDFERHGGMAFVMYLMFFFIKKNHFSSVSGGMFPEQFARITDPKGRMSLHFTMFPDPTAFGPSVFKLSVFGVQKWKERIRKNLTINF